MKNRIHTSFVLRIGAIVGMIVMMTSGLAFTEDVPEGQECCVCAQDEAAFDAMVTEACQNGYSEQGIATPTEEQMTDCITQTKAQILENCPEEATRAAVEGDRDGDGVPDEQDNCPNVPNPQQAQTDPNVRFTGDFPNMCRFIDNTDGTITDAKSGLIWAKSPGRQGLRATEAEEYCRNLNIAGGRWRLPTMSELRQLASPNIFSQSRSSGHPFIGVQSDGYWTSDTTHSSIWRGTFNYSCNVTTSECIDEYAEGPGQDHYAWPVR